MKICVMDLYEPPNYNSMPFNTLVRYQNFHIETLTWFKYFLSWRFKDKSWLCKQYFWVADIPRQAASNDCSIFMLRYLLSHIGHWNMKFTQNETGKERTIFVYKVLVYKVLTDKDNLNHKYKGGDDV